MGFAEVALFSVLGGAGLASLVLLVWPAGSRLVKQAPWAVPLTVALVAVVIDIRAQLVNGGALRYLGTLAALAMLVQLRGPATRGALEVRVLAIALTAFTLIGTLVGRYFEGTETGALPLALPLLLLCFGWLRCPEDGGARFASRVVAVLSSAYIWLMFAQRQGWLSDDTLAVFNHEKSFIVVLGVGASLAARSVPLALLSIAGSVAAFLAYPAATTMLALLAAGATAIAVRIKPPRSMRWIAALAVALAVSWAVLNIKTLVIAAAPYFEAVGKNDNGPTRLMLYEQAMKQIDDSPVFGSWFTGELSLVTTLSGSVGAVVPVHNDYLSLTLGGGIVGASLMLLLFFLINGVAFRALRHVSRGEREDVRAWMTVLLATVNSAAVTAFANPVFFNPAGSTVVYAAALTLVSLSVAELSASSPGHGRKRLKKSPNAQPTWRATGRPARVSEPAERGIAPHRAPTGGARFCYVAAPDR